MSNKIDIDTFLAGYAVVETTSSNFKTPIPNLSAIQSRFLFRVYENEFNGNATGTLHRRRVEEMLKLAYGDRLKPHVAAVHQQLDVIFNRFQTSEITLKEFESCNVKMDMLSGWVRSVLRSFFGTDVANSRLYLLERKYSAQLESQEIMSTYSISRAACDDLRRRFFELCSSPHNSELQPNALGIDGGGQQVVHLGVRAELRRQAWVFSVASVASVAIVPNEVSAADIGTEIPYLDETLARVIYESKVDAFKPKWRFSDFATFCAVFGGGNRTLQAVTVTDAFIQCALTDYYNQKISTLNSSISSSSSHSHRHNQESQLITQQPGIPIGAVSGKPASQSSTQAPTPLPITREISAETTSSGDTSARDNSDLHSYSSTTILSTGLSSPFAQLSPQQGQQEGRSFSADLDVSNVDNYILNALNNMIHTLARTASSGARVGQSDTVPKLPKPLHEALTALNSAAEPEGYAMAFSNLIISHFAQLPGMRDLSLRACCRFGFNPSSPLREMEFVTELSLRYLQQHPQTSAHPSGPVGSEWCVLPKSWYDSWKLYVGHHHHHYLAPGAAGAHTTNTGAGSLSPPVKSARSRNLDTTTDRYSNPYSHYSFQQQHLQSVEEKRANIPASVAGSVLDLDGLLSESPPRTPYFSGQSSGGAGAGASAGVSASAVGSGKIDAIGTSRNSNSAISMKRAGPPPVRPGAIDNTVLLKKTGYTSVGYSSSAEGKVSSGVYGRQGQLAPNLWVGRDIEIVAPAVFDALVAWYGGGPRVSRQVVPVGMSGYSPAITTTATAVTSTVNTGQGSPFGSTSKGNNSTYSRANTGYGFGGAGVGATSSPRSCPVSELELYPLCLRIHTCDNAGYMYNNPLCDPLFSKTCTVQDIAAYMSNTHNVEVERIRLWNYAQPGREQWKEQYVLSPELTLQRANLVDSQIILLEVSLLDGAWPRSLLHAQLDSAERAAQQGFVDGDAVAGATAGGPGAGDVTVKAAVEESLTGALATTAAYIDEYTGVLTAITDVAVSAEDKAATPAPAQSVLGAPFPSSGRSRMGSATANATSSTGIFSILFAFYYISRTLLIYLR